MLCAMGVEWSLLPKPADASNYHRAIVTAAALIPMRIGNWVGQDVPVPHAAVVMLCPNAIVSRRYVNIASGAEANLFIVQCGDARDMTAHYPPVCLVNAGWHLDSAAPTEIAAEDLLVTGTDYLFSQRSFERMSSIRIFNFMILPDGRVARDMGLVNEAAADVQHRYFGAAQVQIGTSAALPEAVRDAAVMEMLSSIRPTIDAVRAGGHP
jgi:hypothetical protein